MENVIDTSAEVDSGVTIDAADASNLGISDDAIMDKAYNASVAAEGNVEAEVEAEPVVATPAKEAVENKDVPVEKAVEPGTQVETEVDKEADEEDELVDATSVTVSSLRKTIEKSPELTKFMTANPAFRNQLFHSARRAERAALYDAVLQTPALAKEASEAAEKFYQRQEMFQSEDSEKFFQSMLQDSIERDAEGRIKLDNNGQPVNNGRFEQHMTHYRTQWFNSVVGFAQQMAQKGNVMQSPDGDISAEDITEAIKILELITNGKSGLTKNKEEAAELPEAVRAQIKELEARKANDLKAHDEAKKAFSGRVETEATKRLETDVKNLLAKRLPAGAAIGDYLKDKVIADTVASVTALASKNAAHQAVVRRATMYATKDDAGLETVLKLKQSFMKDLIGTELRKVLAAATPTVVAASKELNGKINAQRGKVEPRTSGGVNAPSRPDVANLGREIDAAARKAGKPLSDIELMSQVAEAAQKRG